MRITPRADEIAAVVAVLESEKYDDATAMAKALIKTVADVLEDRDWWVLVHRFSGTGINYGPFAYETDVQDFAGKLSGGGTGVAVKVYSVGQVAADLGEKKLKGWCQTEGCSHAGWAHLHEGNKRGRCGLATCQCKVFEK